MRAVNPAPDRWPETEITVCPDGPLLIRGPVRIVDAAGSPIDPGRATVALCRCGATRTAPFCDGTHKLRRTGPAGSRDRTAPEPSGEASAGPTAEPSS